MEPEEVTKAEVLNLYQQGRSTDEILSTIGQRLNLDTARILDDTNMSPLRLIQTLTPNRGGEGEARLPQRMRIDMEALRGRPPAEVAEYMADFMGVNIDRLREDAGMSDSDIIVELGDPESVARAEGFGPFMERLSRNVVRGAPSTILGGGAAILAAPTGPFGSGAAALATGVAAAPLGAALEETVFGPRVPLPPDEARQGTFGEIVGAGIPFLFAPYAFTRGSNPQQLSFLASRTGRDLTPAQSIGVQAVTRPGRNIASETMSLTAGAFGGAAAQEAFPGNEYAQVSAELAAGLAFPAQTLSETVSRVAGPAVRAGEALITRDPTRLSRRVVLRGPEGDERFLDLANSVDRNAASILRQAGWEQLPSTDPRGLSNVMRLRSENSLSRIVANLMRDFQEDPVKTANLLNAAANEPRGLNQLAAEYGISPDRLPEKLPVAGLVDSPTLRAIYATIQSSSEALGPTVARARSQELVRGFQGMENLVRIMAQTGDPEDFADAMRLQQELNETAVNSLINANLAPVTNAVAKFRVDDPTANSRASTAIADAVKESLGLARRQETQLWQRVDRSQPLELTNTADVVAQIRAELGMDAQPGDPNFSGVASAPLRGVLDILETAFRKGDVVEALDDDNPLAELERRLAQEARDFVGEDAAAEAASPTIGNALVLKRNLFSRVIASNAAANPEYGNAQYYGRLYDALMEDLGISASQIEARGGSDALSESDLALLQANSFSRALNDVFTRSFTGEALRRDPVGGHRIQPELLGQAVTSGRSDNTSLAMRDLENSVNFVVNNVTLSPEEAAQAAARVDTLRSNQEMLLRIIASRTTDSATGEINLNRLRNELRPDNPNGMASALQRFPDLLADLQNAETAQAALNSVRSDLRQSARQSQEFAQTVLGHPPGDAVRAALGEPGDRPADAAARLRTLIRLTNQNGAEFAEFARDGLLDTILDQSLVYSGRNTDNFSFEAMRDYLFTPVGRRETDGPTVAAILREQGLLNDQQLSDLNTLLRQGQTVQRALAESRTDSELREQLKEVSPFRIGLIGRFLGAAEAARITQLLRLRATVQAPGVGARIGEALFNKIPRTSLQDTIVKFLDDPEFAEVILRRSAELPELRGNRAIRATQRLARDLQAALVRNGLIVLAAGETAELQNEGITLPFVGTAEAATFDTAPLEAYLQSVQQAAPAPATPAPPPGPTTATPSAGAPPPAVLPAAPPATQAGGQGRASYSALFPNDPIAPLVQQRELQQGIGSLVGPR
jgi:hypothetical protein